MKNLVVWVSIFMCALRVGGLLAFCCMGDGCSNSFAQYVDSQNNPTGHYALLDDSMRKIWIKKGPECECVKGIGTAFPSKTCPQCVEALCPNCGHHIFQHTCSLNVRATPGTGIVTIRE